MLRFLPVVVELVLLVYCLVDCIQTDRSDVRNLGKGWWVLLILFFPVVGGIAWLVAGRPRRGGRRRSVPWPATPTAGFPNTSVRGPSRPTTTPSSSSRCAAATPSRSSCSSGGRRTCDAASSSCAMATRTRLRSRRPDGRYAAKRSDSPPSV